MGPLFLVGMMGSGKSTVGRLLAEQAGAAFVDLDRRLERIFGASVAELMAAGEASFRARERLSLVELLREPAWGATPCVVATGGGVVLDPRNRADMARGGRVVLLAAEPAALARRLSGDASRPLLSGAADLVGRLSELWRAREADYRAAAHAVVDGAGTPEEVAARVWREWVS